MLPVYEWIALKRFIVSLLVIYSVNWPSSLEPLPEQSDNFRKLQPLPADKKYPSNFLQPYFCGQDEDCMTLGSKSALEKAKSNVEKAFPVVGILEDLVTTFKVMEKILPHFFAGVQNVYQEDLKGDEGENLITL